MGEPTEDWREVDLNAADLHHMRQMLYMARQSSGHRTKIGPDMVLYMYTGNPRLKYHSEQFFQVRIFRPKRSSMPRVGRWRGWNDDRRCVSRKRGRNRAMSL